MAKQTLFQRIFRIKTQRDLDIEEFLNHQFFKNMYYWKNIQIHSLIIQSPAKRRVMILFLNLKFDVFEIALREFVSNPNCLENLNTIEGVVIDAIREYEEQAKVQGVPEIFLTKFNEWHAETITDTVSLLRTILQSTSHSDNFSKLIAILDILTFAFRKTIIHAEQTANGLNGQLERALIGTRFDV